MDWAFAWAVLRGLATLASRCDHEHMATSTRRAPVRQGLLAAIAALLVAVAPVLLIGSTQPIRARRAMVVSQDDIASRAGAEVMRDGGNAIDAAVTTAFALAVTYPTAGNIGGGGFLVYRPGRGRPGGLRLPRNGAGPVVPDDVHEGRRVQPWHAPQ